MNTWRTAMLVAKQPCRSLRDLNTAIDSIGEMFSKYHGILTASVHATLVPVLDHDWKAVFRQPWIE